MEEFIKHITIKNVLRALVIIFLIILSFILGIMGIGLIPLFIAIISIFDFDWE